MAFRCGIVLLSVSLMGCATTFRGRTQLVSFTSVPPGARVEVAGRTLTTPAQVELRRNTDHAYSVRLEPCPVRIGRLQSQACTPGAALGWCMTDVIFAWFGVGLPGLLVDLWSGALTDLVPARVGIVLADCAATDVGPGDTAR